MFLVWQGLGLVVGFGAVVLGGVALMSAASLGLPTTGGFVLALAAMAAMLWWVGRRINDPALDKVLIDPETGEQVRLAKRHTLFWIPVQWYAFAPAIMAVVTIADAVFDL